MALPISFNPTQPIPNNPFYSPESYVVKGAYYSLVVGAGLSVSQDGTISSTGGGGVNTIIAGAGISVSGSTGNVTVTNTGVLGLVAGPGISVSASTGVVSISATATGTVTAISTGTGLTGGPITVAGTIALANTAVTAGTYTNPSLTVDAQGRITAANNGTAIGSIVGTAPINVSTVAGTSTVSIDAASTTQAGAVQLSDSVTNTSITEAATANAVKTAFDAAVAAIPKACITGKGGLVSGTGASIPAPLAVGLDGEVLTADSTCTTGLKWAAIPEATPLTFGTVRGCTANLNTALGDRALRDVTTGDSNTAIGDSTLYQVTTGFDNTFVGQGSGTFIVSSYANTGLGVFAGANIGTGCYNTTVGWRAGSSITSGNSNTILGSWTDGITTEARNVLIGSDVDLPQVGSDCQLAIGFGATDYWLSGNSTKAIQPGAGVIDCAGSCGTAGQVLMSNGANAVCWGTASSGVSPATPTVAGIVLGCTISNNTAVGCNALLGNTSAGNTAVGVNALAASPSGGDNTALGSCALRCNTNGSNNVGLGSGTMFSNTTGCYNTAVGAFAFCSNTSGCLNSAFGLNALRLNTTGGRNNAYGWGALGANVSGFNNAAMGSNALSGNLAGSNNASIGSFSLCGVTSGCNNVGLGYASGKNLTTGCNNVAIGPDVSFNSPTDSCQLAIGFSATGNWLTGNSTGAIKPGAGIIDCVNSCGTANQVLVSDGVNAVQWKSVNSAIAAPNYGSFYTATTQTLTTVNTSQPIQFLTLDSANNFSVVSNTQVTAAAAGRYNVQFSLQLLATPGGGGDYEVWPAINGTPIANSNTRFSVKNTNEAECATLNYIVNLTAGQYIELYWATDDTSNLLYGTTSLFGGPDIPSAIITIVPVGA